MRKLRLLSYYYHLCAHTDANKNNKIYYRIEHMLAASPNQVGQ